MIYRYRFISEHRADYGVQRLCRILGVWRQGFYRWLAAQTGRETRAERDEDLAVVITRVHQQHRGLYGRPRITAELRRRGIRVNHKRVGRVMTELGLAGTTRRRPRFRTSPALVPAEPVL
ncbi:IS3 family transposase, partial [Lentzea sp. NPDC051838]|uniref:IS3 family transposase n=1 Tax=Lentzea sp. NPDC051838 TaxID=3154849 RepID=UPI003430C60E